MGERDRDYIHRDVPFFSTHEDLSNKKGKFSKSRFTYLQALVTEFQDSEDQSNHISSFFI